MNTGQLEAIRKAIRSEKLDGWLFCNFHHRDPLADKILGVGAGAGNSRMWFYAVYAEGPPLRIVHGIEQAVLGHLPGKQLVYTGRRELFTCLESLAGKRWGAHISGSITAISYLDGGTAAALEEAGLTLASAAGLIQRFQGLLDDKAIASHEGAAAHLYEIVETAWDRVRQAFHGDLSLREGDIRELMLAEMKRRGMVTDHPPIVGAGINSGNPHYDFSRLRAGDPGGAVIKKGDVLQFDLWAKFADQEGIYADISWIGYYGEEVPGEIEKPFTCLLAAREEAYCYIARELEAGRELSGAAVDEKARAVLSGAGYEKYLRHRTGHGIDTEVHGSGVNMDSIEFPDVRTILEGSCFSLEPGIYFPDYGLRTEINVYILNGKPVISGEAAGKKRQFRPLTC
jgi:Xaa-Pro aminopeptidase